MTTRPTRRPKSSLAESQAARITRILVTTSKPTCGAIHKHTYIYYSFMPVLQARLLGTAFQLLSSDHTSIIRTYIIVIISTSTSILISNRSQSNERHYCRPKRVKVHFHKPYGIFVERNTESTLPYLHSYTYSLSLSLSLLFFLFHFELCSTRPSAVTHKSAE